MIEGLRPASPEASALRRYIERRVVELHVLIEGALDQPATERARGALRELRRMQSDLDSETAPPREYKDSSPRY